MIALILRCKFSFLFVPLPGLIPVNMCVLQVTNYHNNVIVIN